MQIYLYLCCNLKVFCTHFDNNMPSGSLPWMKNNAHCSQVPSQKLFLILNLHTSKGTSMQIAQSLKT